MSKQTHEERAAVDLLEKLDADMLVAFPGHYHGDISILCGLGGKYYRHLSDLKWGGGPMSADPHNLTAAEIALTLTAAAVFASLLLGLKPFIALILRAIY